MNTPEHDGTYTPIELQAAEAAGDLEIIRPGTPEAAAFDAEMADEMEAIDRETIAREGPDAMTIERRARLDRWTASEAGRG